jgi:cell division protein FtsL
MMMRGQAAVVVLVCALVVSALGVVYVKHESRKLFVDLQQLQAVRDDLNVEWGQLQLEQSTWATPGRIENVAVSRLGMVIPEPQQVVTVRR